MVDEVKNKQ